MSRNPATGESSQIKASGKLPIRWVLVRDPNGKSDP
jgi:hypothetical protein